MYGREPDLNEPFRVTEETERRVDREKIYKAWEALYHKHKKVIPPVNSLGIVLLANRYKELGLKLSEEGKHTKSYAFSYFGALLLMKRALYLEDRKFIEQHRELLRFIEVTQLEEELMPR